MRSQDRPDTLRRFVALAFVAMMVPAMMLGSGNAANGFTIFNAAGAGVPGYEPGLGIGADGTVFVNAPGGFPGGHGKVARKQTSDNAFFASTIPTQFRNLPGSGDSDLAVAPPGPGETGNRVYFIDMWVGSHSVFVSNDNAGTWAYATPFTDIPTTDRGWINVGKRDATTGLDTLYLTYQNFGSGTLMLARSSTGGAVWELQRPIPSPTGATPGPVHNAVSEGDTIAVVYGSGGGLRFARSDDAGLNWTSTEVTLLNNVQGQIPGFAKDGDNYYIAYTSTIDGSIQVDYSHDGGVTWGRQDFRLPVKVSSSGTANVFPAVAARNGKVAVSWYSTPCTSKCNSPDSQTSGQWKAVYAESTDGGLHYTTQVAMSDSIARPGLVCTGGLGCDPALGGPGGRQLGDFLQLDIDPAGKSWVAFSINGSLRVARQD